MAIMASLWLVACTPQIKNAATAVIILMYQKIGVI